MSANERQVAGTHYRTSHQHWDMAALLGLGYFEGQITKYLTRHRKKNGRQDVEKALHFAEKLLEAFRANVIPMRGARAMPFDWVGYAEANRLTARERMLVEGAVYWWSVNDLHHLCQDIRHLLETEYPTVMEVTRLGSTEREYVARAFTPGHEPGPGYVNQDR